jgi:hypothetical protein
VGHDELGNRAGIAGQQLAVGATREPMMGRLNDLLGGEAAVVHRGRTAEATQARDRRGFQLRPAMEQEVAEEAAGIVVGTGLLEEAEGGVQHLLLRRRQAGFGYGGLFQPVGVALDFRAHGIASMTSGDTASIERRLGKFTRMAEKTIRC